MSTEGAGLVLHLPWVDRRLGRPLPWRPTAASGEGSTRADTHNLHFMEYLGSVDDALFAELIEDWIAGNPPEAADAWRYGWRPYNLSVRVAVWLEEIARRRDRLPPALLQHAGSSLGAQLRFLTRHLESDLRGNHLIKNIRALAWGGACFVGPEADAWTDLARGLLREELGEQILPDGCHYERSPAYHCQVMSDLLACRAALRQPLIELDQALDCMAAVLPCYTHPDGQIAQWNDGGLTMAPTPGRLASVHAALGGRPAEAPRGPFALPDAGYFGMHAPDELVIVDCGQLGPPYLPGHGHCDMLSFEWSVGGRRIVVDQGTHQYVAGPRRWTTRCTASHNTLAVSGGEQSDIYGAFRCGRRARPELRSFAAHGSGFRLEGSHDGYHTLDGAPRHIRMVEAQPGALRLEDRLEGGIGQKAASHLLLHPDCRVETGGQEAVIRSGPVTVRLSSSSPIEVVPAEWYPDIHVALPTTRLCLPMPASPRRIEFRLAADRDHLPIVS